ncbi:hypothetical protein ACEWY4_020015 [Coilia grayii]|uniref:Glucocorticoid-induced transcript 1 protein n=1 Tax=Coilia grayii TaxID=363190 RepID=A0ABD1JBF6_9TELE
MSATSDTNCHFQQQRLRLGSAGSPSLPNNSGSRLQPIRAIVPYQLLRGGQQSPPRSSSICGGSSNNAGPVLCLSSSPPCQKQLPPSLVGSATVDQRLAGMQRLSPESRSSPERCVISTYRAERPVLQLVRGSTAIRRTSSLDTVTASVTRPYLTGQWPRDSYTPDLTSWTRDKATQTSGLWGEDKGDLGCVHQRSASWGSADHLREIAKLRQQLKKQGVRPCREKEREREKEKEQGALKAGSLAQPKASASSSSASRPLAYRVPSYTEGINQELETVFINNEWEREDLTLLEVQDGRRAPFPPHRHDSGSSGSHGSSSRRSTDAPDAPDAQASSSCCSSPWCCHTPSASPAGPLDSQTSSPWLLEDQDKDSRSGSPLPKYATSPRPNNSFMFKREPPEGCEKVKVFEETVPFHRSSGFPLFSCPDKNKVNFIPTGSAFCPVKMPCSALLSSRSASVAAAAAMGPHTADLVPGSTSPSGDRVLPSGPGTH